MKKSDLPDKLGAPAQRALAAAGITSLAQLAQYTEADILRLHGMGPKSIPLLKKALQTKGKAFATPKKAKGQSIVG